MAQQPQSLVDPMSATSVAGSCADSAPPRAGGAGGAHADDGGGADRHRQRPDLCHAQRGAHGRPAVRRPAAAYRLGSRGEFVHVLGRSAAQAGRHALGRPRQPGHRQPPCPTPLGALGRLLADPPRPVPAADGGDCPTHPARARRVRATSRRHRRTCGVRYIAACRRAGSPSARRVTAQTHACPASAASTALRVGNFAVAHLEARPP